ncbi:major capsid protein P2 [Pseudoalteromonas piscicida]|uniref:major capsid protein P2 n=1 Tax=Pseudoalteromonas piscicida TaxID=43662 RepID=UPI001E2FE5B6|nr:major capsid protein P2 [Pseudoalteromonas piscicida]
MLEVSPLNNLTGVAAGGSVSVTLPVGRTYEKIHFEYSGVTPEQIKNLRVELQGRTLTEYGTLQDLLDENAYFKREQAAGYATLYFARPEIQGVLNPSLVEQRFFSLGTVGLSIVQIKFDIAQDATAPVIKAFAEKSSPSAPGWLFKRRTFRYNFAVGINEIENLPRPLGAKIALIEIKKAGLIQPNFS